MTPVKQLNRHGINGPQHRLISLAAELPAAVLAEFVGMHHNSAVR